MAQINKNKYLDLDITSLPGWDYVCEIKFSRNTIGTGVIECVQEKIRRLKLPRGYSCIPVLIHMGTISSDLFDRDYFAHFVDVKEWMIE